MNDNNAVRRPFPGMGAAPVLTVLVVLVTAALASLALSAALSDAAMTRRSAQAATAFYDADARAAETLAQIDAVLIAQSARETTPAAYFAACAAALADLPALRTEQADDTFLIHYDVESTQGHTLSVSLTVSPPGESARFAVRDWTYLPAADWEPDDTLPVWDGSADSLDTGR